MNYWNYLHKYVHGYIYYIYTTIFIIFDKKRGVYTEGLNYGCKGVENFL